MSGETTGDLKQNLQSREQYWIDRLKPCYNTAPVAASTLGFKMPRDAVERHRKKITGRKLSPEHAAKARVAALGKKNRPETIEKKRLAGLLRGMPRSAIENSAAARRGKPLSPDHIAKFVAANAGYRHSPEVIEKMKASNTPEVREKKDGTLVARNRLLSTRRRGGRLCWLTMRDRKLLVLIHRRIRRQKGVLPTRVEELLMRRGRK